MDQRREYDAELDREWEAALVEADRRLAAAVGPFDCAQEDGPVVIRRGRDGRLKLVAARDDQWSPQIEERFKAVLRATGNVSRAARAVGFSDSAVWQRRRSWPAFAQMLEEMLEDAELALEFRLACQGQPMVADEGESACGAPTPSPSLEGRGEDVPEAPFDPEFAMRFLKWREEKKRGRGRWAPQAKPPSMEDVTELIVQRVEAIKRHRQREAEA